VSGLGGHAYALAAQPGGGTVAVGCGDHTVRLLRPAAGATSIAAAAAAPDILWQVLSWCCQSVLHRSDMMCLSASTTCFSNSVVDSQRPLDFTAVNAGIGSCAVLLQQGVSSGNGSVSFLSAGHP